MKRQQHAVAVVVLAAALSAVALFAWPLETALAAPAAAPQAVPVMTVRTIAPEPRVWPRLIEATGSIAGWQEAVVTAETGGLKVAELLVDEGAVVRRGDVLARLSDEAVRAELRKQDALVAVARANLARAGSDLDRARRVSPSGFLSGQRVEEYEAADAVARASLASAEADRDTAALRLRRTRILAIDDGLIVSRTAVLGSVADVGTELFRLLRQQRVEWRAEIDGKRLSEVQVGQGARVQMDGGATLQGRVTHVGPVLNVSTGRATVRVSLPVTASVKPGMFASGAIELGAQPALTLPQTAITVRDGRPHVHAVAPDGTVSIRPVQTGRRQGDRVEVLTALDAKVRVVERGGAFLADGTRVDVAQRAGKAAL